jgi:hypothetical protein
MNATPFAPLDDPRYQPANPPLPGGGIPDVISKWGPRSQLRWFTRYHAELGLRPARFWERWHCSSVDHKGLCCPSCTYWDEEYGQDNIGAEYGKCCCYAIRELT